MSILHLIFYSLTVVEVLCSSRKGFTPKIRMLCFIENTAWKTMYVKGVYKVGLPKRRTPEMGGGEGGGGENKMCQIDARKKSNWQTDVVTGDETFISFCGVLSKQKIKLWCGSIKPGTDQSSTWKIRLREFELTTFQFALIIIINAFLMRWIPLWLYMCEAESAIHETLQQYTT